MSRGKNEERSREMSDSIDFKYRKLRARIKEIYGTEGKFAEVLHTSQNTVSRKFNGKTQFSTEDIKEWCSLLDISLEESGKYFFA